MIEEEPTGEQVEDGGVLEDTPPVEQVAMLEKVGDLAQSSRTLAYQFLTELYNAYSHGEETSGDEKQRTLWQESVQGLSEDLGLSYELWRYILDEQNYGMPVLERSDLADLLHRRLARIRRAFAVLSSWTPRKKLTSVIFRFEKVWGEILELVSLQEYEEPELVEKLGLNHRRRLKNLERLLPIYQKQAEWVKASFDAL